MPEVRYDLTGDSSSLQQAARTGAAALGQVDHAAKASSDGLYHASEAGEGLRLVMSSLGPSIGIPAERLIRLGRGAMGIVKAFGLAGVATGGVAIALAGMAAAATLGAAGIAKLALGADEAYEAQKRLLGLPGFKVFDQEAIAASHQMGIELEAVGEVWSRFAAQAGEQWAKKLEEPWQRLTIAAVEAGLVMERIQRDGFLDLSAQGMRRLNSQARALVGTMITLDKIESMEKPAAEAAAKAKRDQAEAHREAAAALRAEEERVRALDEAWAEYGARLRASDPFTATADEEIEAFEEVDASLDDLLASQYQREERASQERLQIAEEEARAKATLQADQTDLAERALATGIDLMKSAGMDAFYAEQAQAIASIAISTSRAAMSWAATMGPIGAVAAIALGAVQAGLVLATPPPAYHSGGVVEEQHSGGMIRGPQHDEVDARLLVKEAVLNRRGVQAAGGAAGIHGLNRGEPVGSAIRIANVYQHRVYGDFVADNLQIPGATLARAIRTTRRGPVGHRNRST